MADEAKWHSVLAIAAVGTAGLRIASNRNEVVAAIEARTGVHIEMIPGEEEGRLAYVAARSGLGITAGSLVVFDTGGGSTQFTFGHDSSVDERFSVDVGAVRYTERFKLDGAVSLDVLHRAMAAISADLSRIEGREVPAALVAMGGAVTNITAVKHGLAHYDPTVVQGTVLDRAEVERQIELYRSRDADARRTIIGCATTRRLRVGRSEQLVTWTESQESRRFIADYLECSRLSLRRNAGAVAEMRPALRGKTDRAAEVVEYHYTRLLVARQARHAAERRDRHTVQL